MKRGKKEEYKSIIRFFIFRTSRTLIKDLDQFTKNIKNEALCFYEMQCNILCTLTSICVCIKKENIIIYIT